MSKEQAKILALFIDALMLSGEIVEHTQHEIAKARSNVSLVTWYDLMWLVSNGYLTRSRVKGYYRYRLSHELVRKLRSQREV